MRDFILGLSALFGYLFVAIGPVMILAGLSGADDFWIGVGPPTTPGSYLDSKTVDGRVASVVAGLVLSVLGYGSLVGHRRRRADRPAHERGESA